MPVPGEARGQVDWGSEQPDLVCGNQAIAGLEVDDP